MRFVILLLFLFSCSTVSTKVPGNFFKVSNNLYRGEHPTKHQLEYLRDHVGIKTVINLRRYKRDEVIAGVNFIGLPMSAYNAEVEQVKNFLRIMKNIKYPVFVHCKHGSDRTGLIVAAYRVKFQKWNPQHAYHEMISKRFGFHNEWWNNTDETFIEWAGGLDISDF